MEKEVLHGVVTLGMTVKTADARLLKGDKVKISDDMEIEKVDAAQDPVFGYLLVPNPATDGMATVVTRGKRVTNEVSGEAYSAGDFLNTSSLGKMLKATGARATGLITVVDQTWGGTETVTVNGVVLTVGTEFTASGSPTATAASLTDAINARVPGVIATHVAGVITVEALDVGPQGNAVTLATTDDGADVTVSGATLTGGRNCFPMGIALEAATGADESKKVLWF